MHYFHIGGDDRIYLNQIALNSDLKNITVQNANLSLKETMDVFKDSIFCVGMRFHSVILQTMVSGKNYILDYTEPATGKISGFLSEIDQSNFFVDRYTSLQTDSIDDIKIQNIEARFSLESKTTKKLDIYVNELKHL